RMEPLHHLPRGVPVIGVRLEGRPELPHQGGGADAAADNVAHGKDYAAVAELEHVEPIAADLHASAGGQVTDGNVQARDLRQPLREETALERLRDVPLLLEQASAVDCKGD